MNLLKKHIQTNDELIIDALDYINSFNLEEIKGFENIIKDFYIGGNHYKTIYWYGLQETVALDNDHLDKFNYMFNYNLDIENLKTILETETEFFFYIMGLNSFFAKLEGEIHIRTNYKTRIGLLTEPLIANLELIGLEFCIVKNNPDTLKFHKGLIGILKEKIDEEHEKYLSNSDTRVYDEEIFEKDAEDPEDHMNRFNDLIGLSQLKQDVQSLINLTKIQQIRKSEGLNSIASSRHLVFTGNPGTGKTTVARYLASIYKTIGILSIGQIVEVDRAGLVAGYLGQTAIKTDEIVSKALGGILFIDEAYTLSNDEYGKEAIDTLLKRMEDNRDNLIVIVAGYPKEMRKFIKSNPGLESRFNKHMHFEDYTAQELLLIFKKMCSEQNYQLNKSAEEKVFDYLVNQYQNRDQNFSNARLARNLFEIAISNQATRLILKSEITKEDLSIIVPGDISF